MRSLSVLVASFFINPTATTEFYTLSLHDALPISRARQEVCRAPRRADLGHERGRPGFDLHLHPSDQAMSDELDRKSTRLNSSHGYISYAVFCLKKKKTIITGSHATRQDDWSL